MFRQRGQRQHECWLRREIYYENIHDPVQDVNNFNEIFAHTTVNRRDDSNVKNMLNDLICE